MRRDKGDRRASGAIELDGVRAGETLRWLENSGPLYERICVKFTRSPFEGQADFEVESGILRLTERHCSYASWFTIMGAKPGDVVDILVRKDRTAWS